MYEAPPGLTSSADNVNEETSTDGKKEKPASQMTVGEKFPGLRNAPVQNMGSVADAEAKGMAFVNPAAIKPLAIQVRNVRCLKCKQWGHSMGDPECSMRAHTVEEETFRKHIEDPLLLYDASSGSKVTERLVLRHAIDGTHGGSNSPPPLGLSKPPACMCAFAACLACLRYAAGPASSVPLMIQGTCMM